MPQKYVWVPNQNTKGQSSNSLIARFISDLIDSANFAKKNKYPYIHC